MIFRGDYSYFSTGDVLCKILPETFARNLALLYLGIVAAEIFVFVMIRVGVTKYEQTTGRLDKLDFN